VNYRTMETGDTPLMLANNRGYDDVVALLATYGAEINIQNQVLFNFLLIQCHPVSTLFSLSDVL
jgi:ankyrin repeat protein